VTLAVLSFLSLRSFTEPNKNILSWQKEKWLASTGASTRWRTLWKR
jgi:hypothetical protein